MREESAGSGDPVIIEVNISEQSADIESPLEPKPPNTHKPSFSHNFAFCG